MTYIYVYVPIHMSERGFIKTRLRNHPPMTTPITPPPPLHSYRRTRKLQSKCYKIYTYPYIIILYRYTTLCYNNNNNNNIKYVACQTSVYHIVGTRYCIPTYKVYCSLQRRLHIIFYSIFNAVENRSHKHGNIMAGRWYLYRTRYHDRYMLPNIIYLNHIRLEDIMRLTKSSFNVPI